MCSHHSVFKSLTVAIINKWTIAINYGRFLCGRHCAKGFIQSILFKPWNKLYEVFLIVVIQSKSQMPSSGSGALTFAPPALTLGSSLSQVPYYTLSPGHLHLLFSLLGVLLPSYLKVQSFTYSRPSFKYHLTQACSNHPVENCNVPSATTDHTTLLYIFP